MIQKITQN